MRSRTRLTLAAGMALTGLAFAPVTNAQLFDGQRDHLQKADADNSGLAAAHAAAVGVEAGNLDGVVVDEPCVDGTAGVYACDGIDLLSYIPLSSFASQDGTDVEASDIWGWTDPETGDEIVLLGTTAGTAVFRVTDPMNPEYLGRVENPGETRRVWQDIKVSGNHAYIVSESTEHGMVVVDLTSLRDLEATTDTTYELATVARYLPAIDSHNLVINTDQQMAYLVGSQVTGSESLWDTVVGLTGLGVEDPIGTPERSTYGADECNEGLHAVDISNPSEPVFAGCWTEDEYIHDAQCVTYAGPDTRFTGREICATFSEDYMSFVEVTDKANPQTVGRLGYDDTQYTHQGWFTEDFRYVLMNDELDEQELDAVTHTRTLVVDTSDLDAPTFVGEFQRDGSDGNPATVSIDHNNYTHDGMAFQSNYESGLRVIDLGSLDRDEDEDGKADWDEIAFFDTYPADDASPGTEFNGTWSNYPYFESGTIVVSGIGEGIFFLKLQDGVVSDQ